MVLIVDKKQVNTRFSGEDLAKFLDVDRMFEFVDSDQEIIRICVRFTHKYKPVIDLLKNMGVDLDISIEEIRGISEKIKKRLTELE